MRAGALSALFIFVVLGCGVGVLSAVAQPEPLTESEYWQRVEQTLTLISDQLVNQVRDALPDLWADVESVRVGDHVYEIDTRWIADSLPDGDLPPESVAPLRRYLRALFEYSLQTGSNDAGDASLETLRDVLNDPRFQYDEAEPIPTPVPPPTITLSENSSSTGGELQIVAWIIAGIFAGAIIFYIARMLTVQPVALPAEDADDEPRTSGEAHGRAQSYETQLDYRQAVRYRFLALLLLLDERGIIHYDPSQTNREHVRQLAAQPQIEQLLRAVVNTFDAVWYGYIPLSEADYQQFNERVAQLQSVVQRVHAL